MAIPINILDTLRFFCLKDASDTEILLKGLWISPEFPEYPKARRIYQLDHDDVPLGIFQPDTPADVARVIQVAKKHAVKFTIRGGGHHIMGRCIQRDTLTIDMRRICHVEVAPDKMTATIGGGANNLQVAEALEAHGLVTPIGLVSAVGYVGWATLGGYGSFMNQWGLGVDNIVGAQIVSANGELITADEDLLRGIRGAGGAFGVIFSLTVKVYPLQKVCQSFGTFEARNILN
jgi:FAD/FMN-containing dehydrogenase